MLLSAPALDPLDRLTVVNRHGVPAGKQNLCHALKHLETHDLSLQKGHGPDGQRRKYLVYLFPIPLVNLFPFLKIPPDEPASDQPIADNGIAEVAVQIEVRQ